MIFLGNLPCRGARCPLGWIFTSDTINEHLCFLGDKSGELVIKWESGRNSSVLNGEDTSCDAVCLLLSTSCILGVTGLT